MEGVQWRLGGRTVARVEVFDNCAPLRECMRLRHRVCSVDISLVLDQQPHHRLVAVLGRLNEARAPVLQGTHSAVVSRQSSFKYNTGDVCIGGRRSNGRGLASA